MAVAPLYLADESALARLGHESVRDRLRPLLVEGLVATCPMIDLEILFSALEVQHALATRGHHRVSLPDLLIAAVAELNNISVMHYDSNYDHIAEVSKQATQWVAPRGSI